MTCKVKGCNNKCKCKGYCNLHYARKFIYKIPFTRRCKLKECNNILPKGHKKLCSDKCQRKDYLTKKEQRIKYMKDNYITIPNFATKGKKILHPRELTDELKPLIPIIKNKVLEDCIKNPGKYL